MGHRNSNHPKKNPTIETLIGNDTALDPSLKCILDRQPTYAEIIDKALNQLFAKAQGDMGGDFYSAMCHATLLSGQGKSDADTALKDYARVVFKHAENLATLIPSHRKLILSVFPFSQRKIDQYVAIFRRNRSWSAVSELFNELIHWVNGCKRGAHPQNIFDTHLPWSMYECDEENCHFPIIARLKKHLRSRKREKTAAALRVLDSNSIAEWKDFFKGLLDDCFKDSRTAEFLTRHFVTADSRKQVKGHGRAKSNLLDNVYKRLNVLAGIKAAAK